MVISNAELIDQLNVVILWSLILQNKPDTSYVEIIFLRGQLHFVLPVGDLMLEVICICTQPTPKSQLCITRKLITKD